MQGWKWVVLLAAACGACRGQGSASAPPERNCRLVVWYQPSSDASQVEIVASWNGWARPGISLPPTRSDGWRVAGFDLPPGEQTYAIVDDGTMLPDPNVSTTAFHDGEEVSWVNVADCGFPAITVSSAQGSADGHASVGASFLASRNGDAIDPATLTVTGHDGTSFDPSHFTVDPRTGHVEVHLDSLAPGKYTLTLRAKDTAGRDADDARATVWIEPRAFDPRDTVIYEVMVDRYRNAAGALAPPSPPSARAGGTVDGVRAAIESGELPSLGVNTLWLSPLYANPPDAFPGTDGRPYTGYHGYWPIAARTLEPTQADEASLDALVASAHAHGIRVLFDVVPHHVHDEHPYWAEHEADGWFEHADGSCVCGTGACDWTTHIGDCWFTSYLPSFDWTRPDVADTVTSDVLWWLDRWDGDGIRIDAVPMMPRAATRRIAAAIRARFDHPGHSSFLLGENFTGPEGYGLLRYELGPFGLDSEFHFPLMWALRGALGDESEPLGDVDTAEQTGLGDWNGSGAVMATMIDNHDVTRFASVADGTADGDGWTPAPQPTNPEVYAKAQAALGVLFTLPGAPVVYYGDEIALAGRGDPDSRRVMPAESALSSLQKQTRSWVQTLGAARSCLTSLRRGTYRSLYADAETLVYAREAPGEDTAVVVVGRRPSALAQPLPGIAAGMYVDLLSGRQASLGPELTNLAPGPFSVSLFVPAASACSSLARPGP